MLINLFIVNDFKGVLVLRIEYEKIFFFGK